MKKFVFAAVAAACVISSVAVVGCSGTAQVNYTLSEDGEYCIVSGVTGNTYALKEYTVPQYCVEGENGVLRPATEEDDAGALIPVREIGNSAFFTCAHLVRLNLPEGITKIGDLAFTYCGFEKITIPSTVTEIGASAFGGCDALTEITIPESVTTIGARAFYACDRLERVVIEARISDLGAYVFANSVRSGSGQIFVSSLLTEVHLPSSLKKINVSAFYGAAYLTDVYYDGTEEEFAEVVFYKTVKNEESGEYEEVALETEKRGFYGSDTATVKLPVTMHYSANTPEE